MLKNITASQNKWRETAVDPERIRVRVRLTVILATEPVERDYSRPGGREVL